ncbi:MAG: chemotaxis protein CheX [Planctomycetaceae bacterium]|nr:chemotaxis protein CheX [Planctomycetales bacterium]MCB9927749.1 chemotaxis protein CheX [Planctomycetaceae bacterium]
MRAEHINPFVVATVNAFETLVGCRVTRCGLELKTDYAPTFDISGIIELRGSATGVVAISLSRDAALGITGALLDLCPTEIDAEVVDAVGELANIIAGGAKSKLEVLEMSISLPKVICGQSHKIEFPAEAKPISVPFDSPWGPFCIDVGLTY